VRLHERHSHGWRRLLLVSDNPMTPFKGVKTSESDLESDDFVKRHLQIGIESLQELQLWRIRKHMRFD
jgi:AMP nucleosidase